MFIIYRSETATSPLKETWDAADDRLRQAILEASRSLDQQLATAPQEQGESRDGATRILFQAPLAVLYEVDEVKQIVRILRAWAYRTQAQRRDPLT